jgi:hypothetical protein
VRRRTLRHKPPVRRPARTAGPLAVVRGPRHTPIALTAYADPNRPAASPAAAWSTAPLTVAEARDVTVMLALAVLSVDPAAGREVRDSITAAVNAVNRGRPIPQGLGLSPAWR